MTTEDANKWLARFRRTEVGNEFGRVQVRVWTKFGLYCAEAPTVGEAVQAISEAYGE